MDEKQHNFSHYTVFIGISAHLNKRPWALVKLINARTATLRLIKFVHLFIHRFLILKH